MLNAGMASEDGSLVGVLRVPPGVDVLNAGMASEDGSPDSSAVDDAHPAVLNAGMASEDGSRTERTVKGDGCGAQRRDGV